MSRSVFYSWQSDSPAKTNRAFIRDCLKSAVKSLSKDATLDETVRLDQDTQGIPGTPDIAATIFDKIKHADVFVADVTLSFRAPKQKRSPNPNVMIELGYAFSAISDAKVVTVLNTAFGKPDKLPFHFVQKRHPIQYCLNEEDLAETNVKSFQKKQLAEALCNAIRLVLEASTPVPASLKLTGAASWQYIEHSIRVFEPRQDWELISTAASSVAVFKKDVNLRLVVNYMEEGVQCQDFEADWANRHPDRHATGYWCDIHYCSTRVFRTILVSVDGGRAMLPVPRQKDANGKTTEVLLFDYRLAQIFDQVGTLNEYMSRSRLTLAFD